ncbi:MAG: ATP-binding protein, partial [Flavobacteriaceae bacterium]
EQPYLVVKIRQASNEVYIEVIDSGDGVQQELEERIFEPKFTTKNSGMGLGLAIVKKSIEYHAGQIHYSRRDEAQSCFKIQLPLNN